MYIYRTCTDYECIDYVQDEHRIYKAECGFGEVEE